MGRPETSLFREDDADEMRLAIKNLQSLGYNVQRPSMYQLKIADTNYYPTTGKITIDPHLVHPDRGLDSYLKLLRDKRESSMNQISI